MANVFFEEQRRRSYVTPKSFLELLALYSSMLSATRVEVGTACKRLEGGVVKLREANASVAQMKIELSELQPILEQKSRETNQLLAQVQSETAKANLQKAQVEKEAAAVALTSAEVHASAHHDAPLHFPRGGANGAGRPRRPPRACKCSPRRPLTLPHRWSEWRRTPKPILTRLFPPSRARSSRSSRSLSPIWSRSRGTHGI